MGTRKKLTSTSLEGGPGMKAPMAANPSTQSVSMTLRQEREYMLCCQSCTPWCAAGAGRSQANSAYLEPRTQISNGVKSGEAWAQLSAELGDAPVVDPQPPLLWAVSSVAQGRAQDGAELSVGCLLDHGGSGWGQRETLGWDWMGGGAMRSGKRGGRG
ncbi:hypothetical protein K439DRAFT_1516577 [Ramaria rubella]|nr:hypothetical protein K439DRAFT_1516577 [Ramaria rubella]